MFRFRVRVVLILVFGGLVMVSTRLFYLQIVRGAHYREYADNVRLAERVIEASRGRIFSRQGDLLALDVPSFDIALVPNALPSWRELCRPVLGLYDLGRREKIDSIRDVFVQVSPCAGESGLAVDFELAATFQRRKETELVKRDERGVAHLVVPGDTAALLRRVAQVAGTDPKEMLQEFFEGLALVGRGWRRLSDPCVVARDVDYLVACEIESHQDCYPGVTVAESTKRTYPYDELACHILGYMQRVSASEYARWSESYSGSVAKRLFPDDMIGRAGVERSLDLVLRPARGEQTVEVDAGRHTQRVLQETPAVPGADVYLTLDLEVQRAVEQALKDQVGCAIVLEAATGKILGMASVPGYDANELPRPQPDPLEPLTPMLNRATQGQYSLGSAFKLVLATAALQEGRVFREVLCTGKYGSHECHNHTLPMVVSFHEAIKRSCNVYFYRTAVEMLGMERIEAWGERFGLGRRTGIDLPAEVGGLFPTREWKVRVKHEPWYQGDTRNLAIGQGFLQVTPIQVARVLAAIANGGRLVRPRLVEKLVLSDGTEKRVGEDEPVPDLGLAPGKLAQLHLAMRAVCHDYGGTGWHAWSDRRGPDGHPTTPWIEEQGYAVAGKTSTAEYEVSGVKGNIGWFVGFAPADDPRVAFVVTLIHEASHLHGGDVAAPVARQILSHLPERYLAGVPGSELREQFRQRLAQRGGGTP